MQHRSRLGSSSFHKSCTTCQFFSSFFSLALALSRVCSVSHKLVSKPTRSYLPHFPHSSWVMCERACSSAGKTMRLLDLLVMRNIKYHRYINQKVLPSALQMQNRLPGNIKVLSPESLVSEWNLSCQSWRRLQQKKSWLLTRGVKKED